MKYIQRELLVENHVLEVSEFRINTFGTGGTPPVEGGR